MQGRRRDAGWDDRPPSLIPYGLMVVIIALAALAVLLMLFLNDARRVGEDGPAATPSPSALHLTDD